MRFVEHSRPPVSSYIDENGGRLGVRLRKSADETTGKKPKRF
jgi:hypothetical protein